MNLLVQTCGAMLLLLLGSQFPLKAQNFNLHSNGVTVECTAAAVGDTGTINGVIYTKRTAGQITEANAATTCTSGITDMYQLFYQASTFNGDSLGVGCEQRNRYEWDVLGKRMPSMGISRSGM